LESDESSDPAADQEALHAYAELLSCIPHGELDLTTAEIDKLFELCETKGRPGLYIDFMAHYCKHEATKIDDMADVYTRRVLAYMNDPDQAIVHKVVNCMNSIFGKLPKES